MPSATFICYENVGQGFSLASPLEWVRGIATRKGCPTPALNFLNVKLGLRQLLSIHDVSVSPLTETHQPPCGFRYEDTPEHHTGLNFLNMN